MKRPENTTHLRAAAGGIKKNVQAGTGATNLRPVRPAGAKQVVSPGKVGGHASQPIRPIAQPQADDTVEEAIEKLGEDAENKDPKGAA